MIVVSPARCVGLSVNHTVTPIAVITMTVQTKLITGMRASSLSSRSTDQDDLARAELFAIRLVPEP